MANRKLTFSLPQDLATEFLNRVPATQRSQYVAMAIAAQLRRREAELIRACEIANSSAEVAEIESSFDAFREDFDGVREPW